MIALRESPEQTHNIPSIPSEEELQKVMEGLIVTAQQAFLINGKIDSYFVLLTKYRTLNYCSVDVTNENKKEETAQIVIESITALHVLAVMFISETFVLEVDEKDKSSVDLSIPISQQPDRVENLMITTETFIKSQMNFWEIKDGPTGIKVLGERKIIHAVGDGKFSNLLVKAYTNSTKH